MRSRRAQSESIGVILLTGVVVIIAGIAGAAILGGVAQEAERGSAPLVEFSVEITADNVSVTHAGGDVVAQSELTLVARGNGTTERYGFDDANVTGDNDGEFEPSEQFRRDHGIGSSTVTVLVVHDASNSVLARESADVS